MSNTQVKILADKNPSFNIFFFFKGGKKMFEFLPEKVDH